MRSIPFPVSRLACCPRLALAAAVLALVGGCGGNNGAPQPDETSDPLYQQGLDFKKQERYGEALTAFLREIDRRGENGAPESHLEAALLCLNFAKDPIEAYHHFTKYLELRPNDQKVRGQRDAAKREIARVLLAPPTDQGVQLQTNDELEQLRRRVAELEAENQMLHGSGSFVAAARNPPMISLPDDQGGAAASAPNDSPLTPPPAPTTARPVAPEGGAGFVRSLGTPPVTAPANRAAATVPSRPTSPARAGTPQRPGSASTGGRSYTVQRGDSPYAIARRFYGSADNAKVQAILGANGLHSAAELRPGMVLRIP